MAAVRAEAAPQAEALHIALALRTAKAGATVAICPATGYISLSVWGLIFGSGAHSAGRSTTNRHTGLATPGLENAAGGD